MKKIVNSEAGQIILILVLVMTVALAIGLAVIQRSVSDISTASKVEQSSRAFSAAEAGIERALRIDTQINTGQGSGVIPCQGGQAIDLGNNSCIQQVNTAFIPQVQSGSTPQRALEFPPLGKEDIAHVWLADPVSSTSPPAYYYTQNTLDVYWGNTASEVAAAVEITVVYYESGVYKPQRYLFDPAPSVHNSGGVNNNFTDVSTACTGYAVQTTYGDNRSFACKQTLLSLPLNLILLRARLLYNKTSQPIAFQATGTPPCGAACSLPSQAKLYTSTGASGDIQRTVQVFKLDQVVPPYFDYAIFSSGEIKK